MPAKTIMVQGTASDVGKSVAVTALCRILRRRGYRVAPFKAQNMSNNSFATVEGGEIGRAQAVQAAACGITPSVLMNPILLKPNTDQASQVVVMGKVFDTLGASDYYHRKETLRQYVDQALDQLRKDCDIVVIEGAGSPAEINIKENDIVNMSVAKSVSAPVILVGDIDKGGVFAQIAGTFDLLEPDEQKLVKAFLVNKFRGEKELFNPGVKWIEEKIKRKCLGVIPMFSGLGIEQEDAVVLDKTKTGLVAPDGKKLVIHVIRLPRISNFTDFDPLIKERDVLLEFINKPNRNIIPDLLIIPGTKSTIADLEFLKQSGFDAHIKRCLDAGTSVLGICGGYQMLGESIEDPHQRESATKISKALEILPVKTIFSKDKTTVQVKALHSESASVIEGYEIHMGQSQHLSGTKPLFKITERNGSKVDVDDGVSVSFGRAKVWGTYIHGLFSSEQFRRHFLNDIRALAGLPCVGSDPAKDKEQDLVFDRLADEFEKHIDMSLLGEILQEDLAGVKA